MLLNPWVPAQIDSPVGAAYDLLPQRAGRQPLLDLSQASPPYPPAPAVLHHLQRCLADGASAGYTDVPGLPKLREAFAADLSQDYQAALDPENVLVTSGCNQAFCLVAGVLAQPGDEIVLPLPYYFNHDMWLRLNGITPVYLQPDADLVPRAAALEELITPRTRAVLLVTPGNPTGVTIPPEEIAAFAEVARRHDIALVLDETYRSFRATEGPAHALYAEADWSDHVIGLFSFSKEFAIPGYRVGAVVSGPKVGREVAKLMDCVAVCAPKIGQEAAWAGLTQATDWRIERAAEMASRRAAFQAALADQPGGFEVLACGGYFGWLRHPFRDEPTPDLARRLLIDHDLLLLPGTAFEPTDTRSLRVSIAGVDERTAGDLADRLRAAAA